MSFKGNLRRKGISNQGGDDNHLLGDSLTKVANKGRGFTTGAGSAITQATSITTGVTINSMCGQITTVPSTLAAGAEAVFTVTNSDVAAADVISVSTTYAGAGTLIVNVNKVTAGAFDIVLANLHASNALNAVVVINFVVHKSVAS